MAIKFKIIMTNQWLYSLIAFGFLLALGVGVLAYKSGLPPSVMGHSADEIEGIPPTILVRHNLTVSPTPPACPDGWKKLWEGYSFVSSSRIGQSLGDPGSCLETFIPIPSFECLLRDGQCFYSTSSMWLTTNNVDQPPISGIENIISNISRCVVCEKAAPILVRHSLTSNIPACPDGWKKLWEGYSFAGGFRTSTYKAFLAITAKSGQSLGDPGACLETFIPIPFIKCDWAFFEPSPSCDYFRGGDASMWLTTNSVDQPPISGIENIISNIGRCVVCSK